MQQKSRDCSIGLPRTIVRNFLVELNNNVRQSEQRKDAVTLAIVQLAKNVLMWMPRIRKWDMTARVRNDKRIGYGLG